MKNHKVVGVEKERYIFALYKSSCWYIAPGKVDTSCFQALDKTVAELVIAQGAVDDCHQLFVGRRASC
jgi:hypothetical protein